MSGTLTPPVQSLQFSYPDTAERGPDRDADEPMSNSNIQQTNKNDAAAADEEPRQLGIMSEEEIDYNVMGSFPASDPPSWTLGLRARKSFRTEFEGEKPGPDEPSHQNQ